MTTTYKQWRGFWKDYRYIKKNYEAFSIREASILFYQQRSRMQVQCENITVTFDKNFSCCFKMVDCCREISSHPYFLTSCFLVFFFYFLVLITMSFLIWSIRLVLGLPPGSFPFLYNFLRYTLFCHLHHRSKPC